MNQKQSESFSGLQRGSYHLAAQALEEISFFSGFLSQ
jgi:hypothetical protein